MQISETVLISLITFASGALGLIVGAISTHKAAKLAAKNHLQQIIIRESYSARLAAYQEVFVAHANLLSSDFDKEFEKLFIIAINHACLVSSPQTVVELALFQSNTLSHGQNRVASVVTAMQTDLSVFTEPEVFGNDWINNIVPDEQPTPPKQTKQKRSGCKRSKKR